MQKRTRYSICLARCKWKGSQPKTLNRNIKNKDSVTSSRDSVNMEYAVEKEKIPAYGWRNGGEHRKKKMNSFYFNPLFYWFHILENHTQQKKFPASVTPHPISCPVSLLHRHTNSTFCQFIFAWKKNLVLLRMRSTASHKKTGSVNPKRCVWLNRFNNTAKWSGWSLQNWKKNVKMGWKHRWQKYAKKIKKH